MTLPTKTFVTGKARVLAVKLPDKSVCTYFHESNKLRTLTTKIECIWTDLPEGKWQNPFRAVDATEDEAKKVVDSWGVVGERELSFRYGSLGKSYEKATDELKSLLRANEIYTENPLGEKPKQEDHVTKSDIDAPKSWEKTDNAINELQNVLNKKWELAQQNTGNWYLMIEPII